MLSLAVLVVIVRRLGLAAHRIDLLLLAFVFREWCLCPGCRVGRPEAGIATTHALLSLFVTMVVE